MKKSSFLVLLSLFFSPVLYADECCASDDVADDAASDAAVVRRVSSTGDPVAQQKFSFRRFFAQKDLLGASLVQDTWQALKSEPWVTRTTMDLTFYASSYDALNADFSSKDVVNITVGATLFNAVTAKVKRASFGTRKWTGSVHLDVSAFRVGAKTVMKGQNDTLDLSLLSSSVFMSYEVFPSVRAATYYRFTEPRCSSCDPEALSFEVSGRYPLMKGLFLIGNVSTNSSFKKYSVFAELKKSVSKRVSVFVSGQSNFDFSKEDGYTTRAKVLAGLYFSM